MADAKHHISRELLGKIVDDVFGGAIEDAAVIEEIYAAIKRHENPAPADHEPIGYVSTQTLAELLHDNSGEYKITATHDLMSDDMIAIYTAPDAHPGTPAPSDRLLPDTTDELSLTKTGLKIAMTKIAAYEKRIAELETAAPAPRVEGSDD